MVVGLESIRFAVRTVVEVDTHKDCIFLPVGNSCSLVEWNEDIAPSGDDSSEAVCTQFSV